MTARTAPGVADASVLPLTFTQRRLFTLERWAGVPNRLRAAVPLDGLVVSRDGFRDAVAKLLLRHGVLRHQVVRSGRDLGQVVVPLDDCIDALLPCGDEVEASDRSLALRMEAPLCRFELSASGQVAHVAANHLVCDAVGLRLIERDLLALVGAQVRGAEACLPVLRWQFSDYVAFEQDPSTWDDALASWRADAIPHLARLRARAGSERPSAAPTAPTVESVQIDWRARGASLGWEGQLAKALGLSSLGVVVGATAQATAEVFGKDVVVVNVVSLNRWHPEIVDLVGSFAEIVPVIVRVDLDPSRLDYWRELREAMGPVYRQAIPREQLQKGEPVLSAALSLATTRSVVVNFRNFGPGAATPSADPATPTRSPVRVRGIQLDVEPAPAGLHVAIGYSSAALSPSEGHRFASSLRTSLDAAWDHAA